MPSSAGSKQHTTNSKTRVAQSPSSSKRIKVKLPKTVPVPSSSRSHDTKSKLSLKMRKSSSPVSSSSVYKDKNSNSFVKMRPPPASPCTAASLTAGSPKSNASSLETVVTSRTTHHRDQKASAKMKTLSIESVNGPPSIV